MHLTEPYTATNDGLPHAVVGGIGVLHKYRNATLGQFYGSGNLFKITLHNFNFSGHFQFARAIDRLNN